VHLTIQFVTIQHGTMLRFCSTHLAGNLSALEGCRQLVIIVLVLTHVTMQYSVSLCCVWVLLTLLGTCLPLKGAGRSLSLYW